MDTEGMTTSATDAAPARRFWDAVSSPTVLLAAVATYAYAVALQYGVGYCSRFSIPFSLINPARPLIVMLWILVFIVVGYVACIIPGVFFLGLGVRDTVRWVRGKPQAKPPKLSPYVQAGAILVVLIILFLARPFGR
jgi:hypothetical protein